MTLDPSSGDYIHMTPWRFMVTLADDAAYFGLMVYMYTAVGVQRIFINERMILESDAMKALRWGLMFGTMAEVRRWLEAYGLSTNASAYLEAVAKMFL